MIWRMGCKRAGAKSNPRGMRRSRSVTLSFVGALMLAQGCRPTEKAPPSSPSASGPLSVPLAQLIANSKQYHGKRVRVVGFCHLEFEGNGLYIQGEDYSHGVTKHAIWLEVEGSRGVLILNDDYVVVEGTFSAEQLWTPRHRPGEPAWRVM